MKTAETFLFVFAFISLETIQGAARSGRICSAPPQYPHTRLLASKQVYNSGDKVSFRCAEDFTSIKGLRTVQCQDGKWTTLSLKCEKIRCGNVGDLLNGEFQYEGETFIGEKVYAKCKKGYALMGSANMTCEKLGWAGKFPSCEESCTAPTVVNSVQKDGVSEHFVGDFMNFTCGRGFQLDGAQKIICGPKGEWRPSPPRCVPSQGRTEQLADRKRGCRAPQATSRSNASLADKYITRTSFSSGDRVFYRCNVGYTPVGGSRLRMCLNGKWTSLTLKCERASCGHAGEFENGHFNYTGIHFGDKTTAVCNKGYRLVGQATRRCMSEGWDGRVPVCEVVTCDEPMKTNAARRNFQQAPFSYSNVLIYYCLEGILDGPEEIWCTEDGSWSSPPPQCKVVTCPAPNIPNAFWVNAHKRTYFPRDTIDSFECKRGYLLRGSKYATCSKEGKWLPGLPWCQPPLNYIN